MAIAININCDGNSTHTCDDCKKQYSCYNCPDILNPSYSEHVCQTCLQKIHSIKGKRKTKTIGQSAILIKID